MAPERTLLTARVATLLLVLAALERPGHADPDPYVATSLDAAGAVVSVGGIVVATSLLESPTYYGWSIPLYLVSAGALVVLPSTGHIYAGEWGSTGMELRAVGLGVTAVGGLVLAFECIHPSGAQGGSCLYGIGGLVVTGGLATIVTGIAWDLATAHSAGETRDPMKPHIWTIGGRF
jgi:hypothetical protein